MFEMFKTKIWKLKKNVSFYNRVINIVPKKAGTEGFWEDLKRTIIMNNALDYDQFSALYYAVSLCRTAVMTNQPDILVVSLEDAKELDKLDLGNPYEQLNQDLYITLILTKEGGKEFAQGSLKFSEQEYKEFDEKIMNELAGEVKEVAEKYVENLHVMGVRTTV